MIGIHIRRTDKFRGDTALAREHDDSIVEHLAETLPGCRDCGVFIASDDVTSRQYVGERIQAHGLYVASMAHDFHTDQIRQTGGEELMLDILLLAACERITATVSSGVVDYASLVGNTPVDWVGPDDAADPWFWGGADKRKRETPGFRH